MLRLLVEASATNTSSSPRQFSSVHSAPKRQPLKKFLDSFALSSLKMESKRAIVIPVTLKGPNYLLWSRLAKTAIGGKGLWSHCISDAPNHSKAVATQAEGEASSKPVSEDRWLQEDLTVLSILQSSLDPSILEAYSYCESAKELWSTLKKIYGNLSNLSRVFEIKKANNNMSQEEEEFTTHLGKFRALWSELEMLRPQSFEPDVLNERREQDKVFGLLLTLSPTFSGLIKHLLRSEKLPTLEEVCAQVQKEEGSHGLFGAKEPLTFASHAEGSSQSMKPVYKKGDRRGLKCEHCKRDGHIKEKCWILNPSLKPAKFK